MNWLFFCFSLALTSVGCFGLLVHMESRRYSLTLGWVVRVGLLCLVPGVNLVAVIGTVCDRVDWDKVVVPIRRKNLED